MTTYQSWAAQREAEANAQEVAGYPWRAADIRTHITPAEFRAVEGGAR